MSYAPKKGSLRDIICKWIAEQPKNFEGVTMDEAAKRFPAYHYNSVSSAIFTLKHLGALVEDDGVYQLSDKVKPHYGIYVEPVEEPEPEPSVRAFKPWSGRFSFTNAPRREPIREVSFLSASGAYQPLFGA